jgi:hypothetical protein
MPLVNTNRERARQRQERGNSAGQRLNERIGGWESTANGLKHGTVEITSSGGTERIKVASREQKSSAIMDGDYGTTETSIDVTDGSVFTVGDIIKVAVDGAITGVENLLIQSISSNTLTVRRAVNGTTANNLAEEAEIFVINPKKPTRYTELSSESLTFNRDGQTFNYPKQMQFIPASALTFGSAFTFSGANLANYDNAEYDVMFILKDMQTYSVTGSDESSAQSLQIFADNKTGTGFTPTANIFIGSVLSSSTVTSFDDSSAAFGGTTLSTPAYNTAKTSNDAYDDQSTASVVSLDVTFTLTYSSVVDKGGDINVEGYIRAGTSDGSNAFNSSQYEQQQFTDFRDPAFGAGTRTITKNFTFGSALGNPARVVLTITDFSVTGGSSATLAGALTSITYTTSSGTTRSITGANRADAIVIAR